MKICLLVLMSLSSCLNPFSKTQKFPLCSDVKLTKTDSSPEPIHHSTEGNLPFTVVDTKTNLAVPDLGSYLEVESDRDYLLRFSNFSNKITISDLKADSGAKFYKSPACLLENGEILPESTAVGDQFFSDIYFISKERFDCESANTKIEDKQWIEISRWKSDSKKCPGLFPEDSVSGQYIIKVLYGSFVQPQFKDQLGNELKLRFGLKP